MIGYDSEALSGERLLLRADFGQVRIFPLGKLSVGHCDQRDRNATLALRSKQTARSQRPVIGVRRYASGR